MKPFITSVFVFLCAATPSPLRADPHFLDLKPVANTALEDDGVADNGRGGWSDEGINDMFTFPPVPHGRTERNGHVFELIDPSSNQGKAVVMLRGSERGKDKPDVVEIGVGGRTAQFVYFLQTAAGAPPAMEKAYLVATYEIVYADGTVEKIPIRDGVEIRQWFAGAWWDNSGAASWPFLMGTNVYSLKWKKLIGVWAMQWKNPFPAKPIEKILLRSAGTAVPVVFAITLSDRDFRADEAKLKEHFVRNEPAPAGYFDAKLKLESARIFEAAEKAGHFEGIRSVVFIRPDLLAVTVDGALAESGPGLNNELMSQLQVPETFSLQIGQGKPFHPAKVGRQSTELWKGNVGAFPQVVLYQHTFYLRLPAPLKPGETLAVTIETVPGRFTRRRELAFAPAETITPAIKVNQVAYSVLADERFAYLGWWAGDLGTVDFSDMKVFEVVDEASGKTVRRGDLEPRAAADVTSGESVSQMDLGKLPPGKYHIRIPGFARSDSFGVGLAAGIKDLYYHTMRAFFHQRAGVELKPEHTDFPRPVTHRATYESGYGVDNPDYAPKPGEASREFSGGYHDAGDDDTFTTHLRATAQTLLIYEAFPKAFRDKDLNLPESGNGIPDILDEALWALSFYRDTQRPDGAIYLGQGNDEDYIRGIEKREGRRPAFGLLEPRNNSASEYAAVAAHLARLLRPFDATEADKLVRSARAAYAWAQANPDPDLKPDEEVRTGNKLLLTKDVKHLNTISLNADFQLGANPLSKGFITSLGARHPVQPQLNPFLYSGPEKTGKTVPGITVYGLAGQPKDGFVHNTKWYPDKTPPGRHFVDQGSGSESSSEFTITETIGTSAMLYAFLYALEESRNAKN